MLVLSVLSRLLALFSPKPTPFAHHCSCDLVPCRCTDWPLWVPASTSAMWCDSFDACLKYTSIPVRSSWVSLLVLFSPCYSLLTLAVTFPYPLPPQKKILHLNFDSMQNQLEGVCVWRKSPNYRGGRGDCYSRTYRASQTRRGMVDTCLLSTHCFVPRRHTYTYVCISDLTQTAVELWKLHYDRVKQMGNIALTIQQDGLQDDALVTH